MIFELINEEQANWSDESLLDALENLLKAFAEQRHIVIAQPSLMNKIANNKYFSQKVKNMAKCAEEAVRELKPLIQSDYVSTYIRIDLSSEDKFETVEENQKTVLVSGFAFFKNSSATQSTNILGEDLNDVKFYIYIGNFYIKNNSILDKFALKHSCCHGGGSQTANIYNNILSENKFCYCIVDSDKKHPHSPRGETCKAFFKNADDDVKDLFFEKFGQVRILDAHEVESIIPFNVLTEIIVNGNSSRDLILTIKRLQRMIEKDSNIRIYLDHKKGLNREDAYKLDDMYRKKKKFKGYYSTELNKLIEQNNKCFEHIDQVYHQCDDNCFRFAPMGSKLLSKTLKNFENNNYTKGDIDKITLPYWEMIGKDIFSWCCCYKVPMKVS